MKKMILFFIGLLGVFSTYAQMYTTTKGTVQFFSSTPLENIEAVNNNVSSVISASNDSVLVWMHNTGFVFKNALMQEHFNENYMESAKYPMDVFRGKINQHIDYSKDGIYKVTATGRLTIHGVEQAKVINGIFTVKNGTIHLDSDFSVKTADFKIEIPKLVFEKIAEEIKVTMSADYKLKA